MAGVTSAVIGVAGSVYASKQAKKNAEKQAKLAQQGIEAADPFRQYRPQYAEKLNKLMADPSSIKDTPEYKSRLEAASRQLAAQGYTGSGNALVEAAEAAGTVYQQTFNNLAMLSGANTTPGGGYGQALQAGSEAGAQNLSATSGIINNLSNLAGVIGNKYQQKQSLGTFNQPATAIGYNAYGD